MKAATQTETKLVSEILGLPNAPMIVQRVNTALEKDNQKFFPAPDLIVEVLSKGTEKRDRGIKFQDYQAHEIAEYWIVDPSKKIIEQYALESGRYELKVKSSSGVISSVAIHGLEFSVSALFNRKENYAEIRKILGK